GVITNSDEDVLAGVGGVPWTTNVTPNKFLCDLRYDIAPGDTALIIVILKTNGIVTSNNIYPVTGTQSTFTTVSFPLSTNGHIPDSVVIAAASGNVINGYPRAGSWIEIDAMGFDDGVTWVPAPDGDFEN